MTILTGEKFVIETRKQFQERLGFTDADIARALRESGVFDVVEYHNEFAEEYPEFDTITEDDIESIDAGHYVADNVGLNTQIIETLSHSDGEYIHLYDAPIHTIVRVFPRTNNKGQIEA